MTKVPYSYCYIVVRSDGLISKPKLYRGIITGEQ